MKSPRKSQSKNPASAEEMSAERTAAWQADAAQCRARLLLEIPLLPMDEHLPRAQEICHELCKTGPARIAVMMSFALNYREFIAIHFRLARAVQPTGDKIDRLSALAGAIVTRNESRFDFATSLWAQEEVRLSEKGDMEAIRKMHDLLEPARETHRNYQIWLAVDEVVKEWALAQNPPKQATRPESLPGEMPFPTMSDVRRWIAVHTEDSRFDTIRTLDEKGWHRLREDSGVNVGEKAYHVLAEMSGMRLNAAELAGFDEFLPTSILERGGRGKARIG